MLPGRAPAKREPPAAGRAPPQEADLPRPRRRRACEPATPSRGVWGACPHRPPGAAIRPCRARETQGRGGGTVAPGEKGVRCLSRKRHGRRSQRSRRDGRRRGDPRQGRPALVQQRPGRGHRLRHGGAQGQRPAHGGDGSRPGHRPARPRHHAELAPRRRWIAATARLPEGVLAPRAPTGLGSATAPLPAVAAAGPLPSAAPPRERAVPPPFPGTPPSAPVAYNSRGRRAQLVTMGDPQRVPRSSPVKTPLPLVPPAAA